jgi:hypothetical protein
MTPLKKPESEDNSIFPLLERKFSVRLDRAPGFELRRRVRAF